MKNFPLLVASLLAASLCAAEDGARVLMAPSPMMDALIGQASARPAAASTGEEARILAGSAYTGENASEGGLLAVSGGPIEQAPPAAGDITGPRPSPAPSASATPVEETPKASAPRKRKPPIDPKYIKGPLVLGAVFGVVGLGLALTGGPGLAILAVGVVAGAGLGVGGLLYGLNKRLGG